MISQSLNIDFQKSIDFAKLEYRFSEIDYCSSNIDFASQKNRFSDIDIDFAKFDVCKAVGQRSQLIIDIDFTSVTVHSNADRFY